MLTAYIITLLTISLVSVIVYGVDKIRSLEGRSRIPENVLIAISSIRTTEQYLTPYDASKRRAAVLQAYIRAAPHDGLARRDRPQGRNGADGANALIESIYPHGHTSAESGMMNYNYKRKALIAFLL